MNPYAVSENITLRPNQGRLRDDGATASAGAHRNDVRARQESTTG
jgi:hypothetical protein